MKNKVSLAKKKMLSRALKKKSELEKKHWYRHKKACLKVRTPT